MARPLSFVVVLSCTLLASAPASAAPPAGAREASAPPAKFVHKASGVTLVLIPAGEFQMGSPPTQEGRSKGDRERLHRRVIRKAFYLAETEVTVAQFRAFVEASGYQTDAERGTPDNDRVGPGSFATVEDGERDWNAVANWRNPFPNLKDYRIRDDHPVVHVSWNDAKAYAAHYGLRLPSEAEWEYAARAGSTSRYPWGESEAAGEGHANVGDLSRRRRFASTNIFFPFDDGEAMLSAVRKYKPNAWGLYDMIGNVEEWVEDAHGPYPPDGSDESAAVGNETSARVLRGGAWIGNADTSRAATRIGMRPTSRRDFEGFRAAADTSARAAPDEDPPRVTPTTPHAPSRNP